MKKTLFGSLVMLVVLMMPMLTSCGGDDGDSSGSVNYTSDEIVELLTGKWEVYGHVKMTSSNTDIIENIDGDYTGTIEFLDTKKVKVNSSVIQEIKQTDTDGSKYTVKITLRDFISDYYKYSIIRKNGAAYISFGTGDENRPNHYKIVSLTKNSFKLIRDETRQLGDNQENPYTVNQGTPYTVHYEITIISQ